MIPASWRGRFLRLAVILSVCLNAAFIITWMVHASGFHRTIFERFSLMPMHAESIPDLYRDLRLTPDQWKRLETRAQAFHRYAGAEQKTIVAGQKRLLDLLETETAEGRAIRLVRTDIIDGKARLQGLVIDHILSLKGELTPEQQRKMFSMLRRKCLSSPHLDDGSNMKRGSASSKSRFPK